LGGWANNWGGVQPPNPPGNSNTDPMTSLVSSGSNFSPSAGTGADLERTLQISYMGEMVDTADISRNCVTLDNTGNTSACYILVEVQGTADYVTEVMVPRKVAGEFNEDGAAIVQEQSQNLADTSYVDNSGSVLLRDSEIIVELLKAPEITSVGQTDDASVVSRAHRILTVSHDTESCDTREICPLTASSESVNYRMKCKPNENIFTPSEKNHCEDRIMDDLETSLPLIDAFSHDDFELEDGSDIPNMLLVRYFRTLLRYHLKMSQHNFKCILHHLALGNLHLANVAQ
jgi:hypothetical protein